MPTFNKEYLEFEYEYFNIPEPEEDEDWFDGEEDD